MKYLEKKFKDTCKQKYASLGFKPYRQYFYRVVNDVFQGFGLHQSVYGESCTVEFSIRPLCLGPIIRKDMSGPKGVKQFENNDHSWFEFDRDNLDDVDRCVNSMFEYMDKYLIPYFEEGNSCEKAYIADIKYGFYSSDYESFFYTLKAGWYDKSIEHLLGWKKQIEEAFEYNSKASNFNPSPEYCKRINERLERINYYLEIVSKRDLTAIQNLICDNERAALNNLGKK